jgi:hypothetical protein
LPSVVSASKSGATAPICRAILRPHVIQFAGEFFAININSGEPKVNVCSKKARSFSATRD